MKVLHSLLFLVSLSLVGCGMQPQQPPMMGFNGGFGQQAGFGGGIGFGGNYPGGCAPIQSGAFGFTAQGAQMNGAIILAGTLPANSTQPGQYGQVTMGGNMQMMPGMIQYQPKVSQSGQIQITVSPQNGVMTGVVQLSQAFVFQLMAMQGFNTNPYMINQQSQLCVTSMAFDIVHTTTAGYNTMPQFGQQFGMNTGFINQALVYLTLNNGQSLGPIAFY